LRIAHPIGCGRGAFVPHIAHPHRRVLGAGSNPNYGTFTANMTAPIGEINAWRGVWLYIPAAAPSCPADLSGDGTVGPADLAQLLNSWGSPKSAADIDGDGAVNAQDLAAMLAAWGDC
jgi:hypothetical protein